MKRSLEDYRGIVDDKVIAHIHKKVRGLLGKHILHINSTYQGGGVAEMLQSLIPLMNDIGIDAGWRILHGNPDFFSITKKFHNALQGESINFSEMKKNIYMNTNENFSVYTHIEHDFVIVHDPQPLPLIRFYRKQQPWIWRCHIDLSNPCENIWEFIKKFILKYDTVIVSNEQYKKTDLPVEQVIFMPAIDPLSVKNMALKPEVIQKTLKNFKIPTDKPIMTQISRFDKWKDPVGVVEVFKQVKSKVDCRLVLCGSMAPDDPEGWAIYEKVRRKSNRLLENGDIILITSENNILVNVLQRVSHVVIQKSLREGFGLTVTEALWKEKPVVASKVGGIPLQIKDGESGYLIEPNDTQQFAEKIIDILNHPELAKGLGEKGKEFVRKHFLITRLLGDYLSLLNEYLACPVTNGDIEYCHFPKGYSDT